MRTPRTGNKDFVFFVIGHQKKDFEEEQTIFTVL